MATRATGRASSVVTNFACCADFSTTSAVRAVVQPVYALVVAIDVATQLATTGVVRTDLTCTTSFPAASAVFRISLKVDAQTRTFVGRCGRARQTAGSTVTKLT